jgi:pyruvate dehydrogenase E2 component (dihydrolipoamide acetyltransferase)
MPVEVIFPKVDMDMESGVLSEWLCAHGDAVKEGQPIFVIETDKSAMEIEAAVAGRIAIGDSAPGSEHNVGSVLAHIYDTGEVFGELASGTTAERTTVLQNEPLAKHASDMSVAEAAGQAICQVTGRVTGQAVEQSDSIDAVAAEQSDNRRLRASPAARRIAAEYNIPLSAIAGSAPKGRIVKADVLAAAKSGADRITAPVLKMHMTSEHVVNECGTQEHGSQEHGSQEHGSQEHFSQEHGTQELGNHEPGAHVSGAHVRQVAAAVSPASNSEGITTVPHSQMRRTIATRLTRAVQTIPSYQIAVDCNCQSLIMTSEELSHSIDIGLLQSGFSGKVSLNVFFVRALALALSDIGEANCQWTEDEVLLFDGVDIGVAVALDGGLITPVITSVERKSLLQIAQECQSLIARTKAGSLTRSEYQGGVTTVSNLGMYGIPEFSSIINPPQASIVSVGAVEQRAVVVNDAVKVEPMCRVTFTFDHRVIDGAVGARLASRFKEYVERSVRLLL